MSLPIQRHLLVRICFYLIGILSLSFGISCSIRSQLGAAPMPSFQVGLQQTLGLTVGSWEFIVGAIFIAIIALVRREKPQVLAFLSSFLTGLGIDLWLFVGARVYIPEALMGKFFFLCMGLLFIGLGVSLYLQSQFPPAPPDGMVLLIEDVWQLHRAVSRTLFSTAIVLLAFLLGGPIGLGTLVMMVGLGPMVAFFYPKMELLFQKMNRHQTAVYPMNKEG